MITVNLWDENCRHLAKSDGRYSMVHEKISKNVKFVRDLKDWDGITIFTDQHLNKDTINSVDSKYKIGWLVENRNIYTHCYESFESYCDELDFIMTNDEYLLNNYPSKTKFVPFGGSWVKENNFKVQPKNKLVSMIYSFKTSMPGHVLRHQVANFIPNIDLYGTGCNKKIDNKEEGLSDYMFTIVIENFNEKNYFTEKLVDPLILGTIPIYWGCPNIDKFFDSDGIITFNDVDELKEIVSNLSVDKYNSLISSVNSNFKKSLDYEITEDWIYDNILSKLGLN